MDPALIAAVTPTVPAGERTLPVSGAWAGLIPEGGLVRGRTFACDGLAAPSTALSLVTEACRAGSWLAIVDLPWLGVEAAAGHGIPVQRIIRVDAGAPDGSPGRDQRGELWGEVLGAALDGFDLILTRVPPRAGAGIIRRIRTRLRSRGAILGVIGSPGLLEADLALTAGEVAWDGVGPGHGHLRSRRVSITASGRRVPRPRTAELHLPGPDGAVAEVVPAPVPLTRPTAGNGEGPSRPTQDAGPGPSTGNPRPIASGRGATLRHPIATGAG